MRIDKYLWCVRLYKTRSLASEDVRQNRVQIDGENVKSSREVKVNETISIRRQGFFQTYQVLDFPKNRVGAKLVPDYLIETTPKEELEKKDFLRLARSLQRDRGTGRPTKKERRDLDQMTDPD